MRIVSLLPSATEILFELGLGDDVVGVTFECDFPDAARSKRIVSTSALPPGLSPSEIDAVVKQRIAAGDDLHRLDRGAFAEIDPELVVTIRAADAEVVVVSPCGYRLDGAAELAAGVIERGVLPEAAEVWAIDADAIVVRPGPRVVDGVEVLASILHPDRCDAPPADLARRVR